MVQYSGAQLLEHFTAADIDKVADVILSRAGPHFLDRAVAHRLETIDARGLVNALARAERLGYDVQDIVEEKGSNGAEHVFPSQPRPPPPTTARQGYTFQTQQHPLPNNAQGQPERAPGSAHFVSQQSPHAQQPGQMATPTKGPAGIHYCQNCARPCSGKFALGYVSFLSAL